MKPVVATVEAPKLPAAGKPVKKNPLFGDSDEEDDVFLKKPSKPAASAKPATAASPIKLP